ncbi:MAG: hypothetical protein ABR954_09220 [Dehalococcoidales bacterium]
MKINAEKGQALLLVMLAIALGSLVIPPFLAHADASIIGSRNYAGAIYSQYACDSGAEHAIWSLTDGTIAASIATPGKTVNYMLPESINNLAANVTVCNSYQTIASENFNSGTWTGGTGWLDDWTHSGESAVVNTGSPYEGAYHLRLRSNDGVAKRSLNLSHEVNIYINLWAKVDSVETNEYITCQVSSDNLTWTTVYTWTDANSDSTYHHYLISLASNEMTSHFWISFNAHMGSTSDYFYVDKMDVIWLASNPTMAASDDFESGDGTGGSNWVDNWTLSGDAIITSLENPYQGNYHLRLRNSTGVAKRSVDLSGAFIVTLQFWAKVNAFEGNDKATCQVSSDNLTWTTVYTWTRALDDNTYHLYTIDLTSFDFTSRFWISFHANMNQNDDYFYVDNINVQKINGYGISVKAGDSVLKAVVLIDEVDNVTVSSWYYT